ncbi:hypothetical protein R1sor_014732 [Riccia sorocarpa]|uniref:Uncharacterized protein n=1 Tax=Riccia sorocarpa TaxID=122646 RepID=A0ABD3HAI8_9MARC
MADNTLPDVGGSRDAENVPTTTIGEKSYLDRHSLPNPSIMVVSRSIAYRDAKALLGSVNHSFNFLVAEEFFPTDKHVDVDLDGGRACVVPIATYNPTLDEAIYRCTWKFQGLLDSNNVSMDLQETILTILFGSNAPSTPHLLPGGQPDYRDMSLGSLLRYVGHEWRGGELGLRGLSSLDGIFVYSHSKQDNYQCGGLKCRCTSRPPSGLQRDCEVCTERCEDRSCRLPRRRMECFDYIFIGSMLKMICMSRTYCHAMLSMWRAKHRWFQLEETELAPNFPIKDWWDGTKAKEVSWVWDSETTWELPVACSLCLEGDPRNVALLAHWDGFQSASTVFQSTWTPFIEELIDLFINGVEVEFNYPSELIGGKDMPKRFKLRIMLVLFTGDHPAQCKFGGFATSGYSGCRRCKMKSRVCNVPNSRVVVYDSNREQYRHPAARKTVSELQEAAVDLDACVTGAARKELSQRTGVTGDSQVWKLFDLYGFNPSEDLTYDAMHVLALTTTLSMFKKYTELLKKDAERTSAGRDTLLSALAEVTKKKARCLQGRWSKDPFNRLGFFKAEEYTNFLLYCVPHILYEMGYEPGSILYDLGRLVFEIAKYFYIASRSQTGWTEDMVKKCYMLFASWRIRHEEGVGASGSILDHVTADSTLLEENTVHLGNGSDSSASIRRGILLVSSQRSAKDITSGIMSELRDQASPESASCTIAWEKGIGVGTRQSKNRRVGNISRSGHQYLQRYWESVFGGHLESDEVSPQVTLLRSTMVKGNLYRAGDYAFVLSDSDDRREINWRWKTKITRLFAHTCRGETQMFFEGKWLFNSTARTRGQEHDRFDPISNMEILDQHERTAAGDSCRPVHLLECHFVPVLQKKPGDNHVLAISTGPYRRHSTLFEEAGIGHPPPHPEVNDVMLAVHLPDCPMTATEHSVITSVQVSDEGPTLAERGDVDGAVPVRGQTNTTVQVQWLRRTFPLRWEVNNRRSCCRSMSASQLRQRLEGFTRNSESRMWEYSPR